MVGNDNLFLSEENIILILGVVIRFLLGILQLQIHHIGNSFIFGRSMGCYPKGNMHSDL